MALNTDAFSQSTPKRGPSYGKSKRTSGGSSRSSSSSQTRKSPRSSSEGTRSSSSSHSRSGSYDRGTRRTDPPGRTGSSQNSTHSSKRGDYSRSGSRGSDHHDNRGGYSKSTDRRGPSYDPNRRRDDHGKGPRYNPPRTRTSEYKKQHYQRRNYTPYRRVDSHRNYWNGRSYYDYHRNHYHGAHVYRDWGIVWHVALGDGYYYDNYPYYVFNGLRYRYSQIDHCNVVLEDEDYYDPSYSMIERTFFGNFSCNIAVDMCIREAIDLNDYYGYDRYVCKETRYGRDYAGFRYSRTVIHY